METQELVRADRLDEALAAVQQQIRGNPSDAKLRVFLFQLLSVLGQWERALTQLNVAAEMDAANLLMAQVARAAIACETFRAEVFEGTRQALIFGEPAEWVGWLLQSNQLLGQKKFEQAQELRDRAFEAAPAVAGKINDQPFEWLADADPRLGPMFEAIIDGRYFWLPMQNVREVKLDEPTDLRDVVWTAVNFTFTNGGTSVGLIPTRYAGSHSSTIQGVPMARRTEWTKLGPELEVPIGQRLFATDVAEYPILETRRIVLGDEPSPVAAASEGGETDNG
jgi:type VI secretion system protein ImpE